MRSALLMLRGGAGGTHMARHGISSHNHRICACSALFGDPQPPTAYVVYASWAGKPIELGATVMFLGKGICSHQDQLCAIVTSRWSANNARAWAATSSSRSAGWF